MSEEETKYTINKAGTVGNLTKEQDGALFKLKGALGGEVRLLRTRDCLWILLHEPFTRVLMGVGLHDDMIL